MDLKKVEELVLKEFSDFQTLPLNDQIFRQKNIKDSVQIHIDSKTDLDSLVRAILLLKDSIIDKNPKEFFRLPFPDVVSGIQIETDNISVRYLEAFEIHCGSFGRFDVLIK